MRRLIVLGVLSLAGLIAPPSSLAFESQDSVSGSGVSGGIFGTVNVDARSDPGGQGASGNASIRFNAVESEAFGTSYRPMFVGGPITCLDVRRNVANFNIDQDPLLTSPGMLFDAAIRVEITDNAGTGEPDTIQSAPTEQPPGDCTPLKWGDYTERFDEGDFVVLNSAPVPTYTVSCKRAGGMVRGRGKRSRCVPVKASACRAKRYKRFGFKKRSKCVAFAKRAAHRARR
jgi:hypothetical protein